MNRWVAILFAVGLLGIAFGWQAQDEDKLLAGAPTATAKVVDVTQPRRGKIYLTLDITLPDGRVVRSTTTRYGAEPAIGSSLQVQYVVDGSEVYSRQVGVNAESERWWWIGGGVASILCAVGLFIAGTRRDQQIDPVQDAA